MRGLAVLVLASALGACSIGWAPVVYRLPTAKPVAQPGQYAAVATIKAMMHHWVDRNLPSSQVRIAHERIEKAPEPRVFWTAQTCRNEFEKEGPKYIWWYDWNLRKYRCLEGLTFGWHAIFVSLLDPQMSRTALSHEFGHNYRYELFGDSDSDHLDTEWWDYFEKDINKAIRWQEENYGNLRSVRNR